MKIKEWFLEKITKLLVEAATNTDVDDDDLYAGFVVVT